MSFSGFEHKIPRNFVPVLSHGSTEKSHELMYDDGESRWDRWNVVALEELQCPISMFSKERGFSILFFNSPFRLPASTDQDPSLCRTMPKVKTNRVKYPEGWELIEPTLRELQAKMREAENDPHDGKRKCETLWPIFKIAHQKSRYIFDLYHRRKEISKELYEFCLDQGYADRNLIAKWKKPGYERLCCLRCMQPRDHNFATTCVCRVPKHLREEKVIECVHCGCKGCASGD
ncbi:hypothetical protein V6N12_018718 [Hibiscus sabdariffa]|uniref:G10 protein n=2 Tax=Hibiscus sabdariffa TaxID=183260 RepID=A0ABR2A6Z2_9ROSI